MRQRPAKIWPVSTTATMGISTSSSLSPVSTDAADFACMRQNGHVYEVRQPIYPTHVGRFHTVRFGACPRRFRKSLQVTTLKYLFTPRARTTIYSKVWTYGHSRVGVSRPDTALSRVCAYHGGNGRRQSALSQALPNLRRQGRLVILTDEYGAPVMRMFGSFLTYRFGFPNWEMASAFPARRYPSCALIKRHSFLRLRT